MPKISVIIPIYNSEEYLPRCLDSVCNQTLRDIEIICIDDCSSDKSLEILEEYSQNYPNLIVKHLEKNQGVSVARNTGLALSSGEYLAFVDNDDEVDLNFYQKLYEKAKEENADIVRGQVIEMTYNGQKNVVNLIQENNKWFFISHWWPTIYRRSLILENNISFTINHILGEDILFLNQAVTAAKNLQFVNDVYYHYYRREDSFDSKILSEEKIKSALCVYELIIDNCAANVLPANPAYHFIFHHFIMNCFYLSLKNDEMKSKQLCALAAISIFGKCQSTERLEVYFSSTTPHLFLLLRNKDKVGIEDILLKCKSRMELIASGLRARIQNKK